MELSSHQISLEPFGTYAFYPQHQQDMELGGSDWIHPQPPIVPASTSLLFYHAPVAEKPKRTDRDIRKPWSPSSTKTHDPLQGATAAAESPNAKAGTEEERQVVAQPKQAVPPTVLPLRLHQQETTAKRARATDDVDGEGTASLSCKKRRLLLRLITSRLSQPFSFPATHILIRESTSGNNAMPALHHRLRQQLAYIGARRGVGHHQGSALIVRKAAILNRVRISVHKAAVTWGTTFPAASSMHARGAAAPTFSGSGVGMTPPVWRPHTTSFQLPITHGYNSLPPHQQYHHSQQQQQQQQQCNYNQSVVDMVGRSDARHASTHQMIEEYTRDPNPVATYVCADQQSHKEVPAAVRHAPFPPSHPPAQSSPVDASDEEDNTAFPARFHNGYADLSDDDMDDVYADFGVLFGPGVRSPEARSSSVEEQYYEEYLDELDGIPWIV